MRTILICILCYSFFPQQSFAQITRMLGGHAETIYPLTFSGDEDSASLLPFKEIFLSKQIIGLGEMTHGSREFNEIRIRLLKYLFTHCDYRSVIFEGPFSSFLFIDEYVNGGEGILDSLLRNTGYWMFYTPEVKEFFNWVRSFNSNRSPAQKVHVYGMDMQVAMDGPWLLRHKAKLLPDSARLALNVILDPLLQDSRIANPATYKSVPGKLQEQLASGIPKLYKWLDIYRRDIDSLIYPDRPALLSACIRNMEYTVQSLTANDYFRDSCMRNNVQSLVSINGGKATLWAHNYHIGRDDTVVNNVFYRNMLGQQLHDTYGSQYYPVGFLFDEGGFLAQEIVINNGKTSIPWFHAFYFPSVKANKLTHRLSSLSSDVFFVDISTSYNPVWQKTHQVYMAGGTHYGKGNTSLYLNPSAVFDGIIFVRKVSAIEQLDDSIRPTR